MESCVLNYSPSFITSLVVRNSEACAVKLNSLYPAINYSKFASVRRSLERKGLVSKVIEAKKINKQHNNVEGVDLDEIRKIVSDNIELSAIELNKLFPHISWQRFSTIKANLPEIKAKNKNIRLYKQVEKYRKLFIESKQPKKNKNKKSTNFYEDGKFEGKNFIRNFTAELIAESGVNGVIPCLPHFDWFGEVAIDKLNNENSYLGIADNMNVFNGANIKKDLLGIKGLMVFGSMYDVLKQYSTNSFAHINMDFCGVLPKQAETIAYAIDNDLVQVGGYIFLTFKRVVRKVKYGFYAELFNDYKTMYVKNDKQSASDYANDMLLKNDLLNDRYKLVKKIQYQTKSPMVFYVVQRIK